MNDGLNMSTSQRYRTWQRRSMFTALCIMSAILMAHGTVFAQEATSEPAPPDATPAVSGSGNQVVPGGFFNPTTRSNEATFVTYDCDFQPTSNSVLIRAGLAGSDARAILRDEYTLEVRAGEFGTIINPDRVTVTNLAQRPPIDLVVVFDTTETVPILEVVSAFSSGLAEELAFEDRVALVRFDTEVYPATQFYTDKNLMIANHLINPTINRGANVLYDAIYEGLNVFINEAEPSGRRRALLVITDSGRRPERAQTPTQDLIARSIAANAPIYSIGYFYVDQPDRGELLQLATATNGYAWIYEGEERRAAIGAAVAEYLNEFVRLLNSEVEISIDLSGQQLQPPGEAGLPFSMTLQAQNERLLSVVVNCPVRALNSSIAFADLQQNQVLVEPQTFTVAVNTELNDEDTLVAFWVNDQLEQNSGSRFFELDVPSYPPGPYTLRAELRDSANTVLTSTLDIPVFFQQALRLGTVNGVTEDLTGPVEFQAIANVGVSLPEIVFQIVPQGQEDLPDAVRDVSRAALRSDSRALFTIDNIRPYLRNLFPDGGTDYLLRAIVPGAAGDPPLAESELAFTISSAPETEAERLAREGGRGAVGGIILADEDWTVTLGRVVRNPYVAPILGIIITLIINVLLFRQVARVRIRRMIYMPDDIEMSDRMMAVTTRRSGVVRTYPLTKKTVFVGRGSQNDINIGDDVGISRQHGVVMWRRGRWYYANRHARSVTRIDGRRTRGFNLRVLEPITELEIGNTHLYFHSNAQQDISELTKTNL